MITHDASGRCDHRRLDRWIGRGGPLPADVAAHVEHCERCARRVRQANEVFAAMALVRTLPVSAGLIRRGGGRGLRMLRRASRVSLEARRALAARPGLTYWQRTQLQVTRVSLGLVAAALLMVMRTGIIDGFERTRAAGARLAQEHWDKHIDPEREWFGEDRLA